MSQTELQTFYMTDYSMMYLPEGWEVVTAAFVMDSNGHGQWKILCKRTQT